MHPSSKNGAHLLHSLKKKIGILFFGPNSSNPSATQTEASGCLNLGEGHRIRKGAGGFPPVPRWNEHHCDECGAKTALGRMNGEARDRAMPLFENVLVCLCVRVCTHFVKMCMCV